MAAVIAPAVNPVAQVAAAAAPSNTPSTWGGKVQAVFFNNVVPVAYTLATVAAAAGTYAYTVMKNNQLTGYAGIAALVMFVFALVMQKVTGRCCTAVPAAGAQAAETKAETPKAAAVAADAPGAVKA